MADTLVLNSRATALILIDLQDGTLSLPLIPDAVALVYESASVEDETSSFTSELHRFNIDSTFPLPCRARNADQPLERLL